MRARLIHSVRVTSIAILAILACYSIAYFLGERDADWLVPSMGAGLVLFTMPIKIKWQHFIALNLLAAFLGLTATIILPQLLGVIVALAITLFIMDVLGIAHPPAGATAVLTALRVETTNYTYLLYPMLPNLLILSIALFFIQRCVLKPSLR